MPPQRSGAALAESRFTTPISGMAAGIVFGFPGFEDDHF
jgi:hypothetical protein